MAGPGLNSKKRSRDDSDSAVEVEDSDDDRKPTRYKPRAVSRILTGWNFDLIRPEFQRLMLIRDGAELRDGAPMRTFNMHLILAAANNVMARDAYKRFRKEVTTSWADKDDV